MDIIYVSCKSSFLRIPFIRYFSFDLLFMRHLTPPLTHMTPMTSLALAHVPLSSVDTPDIYVFSVALVASSCVTFLDTKAPLPAVSHYSPFPVSFVTWHQASITCVVSFTPARLTLLPSYGRHLCRLCHVTGPCRCHSLPLTTPGTSVVSLALAGITHPSLTRQTPPSPVYYCFCWCHSLLPWHNQTLLPCVICLLKILVPPTLSRMHYIRQIERITSVADQR